TGGGGDDVIEGGAGADTLDGAAGIDTLSYAGSATGIVIDLGTGEGTAGDAAGDRVTAIENVVGSRSADAITGDDAANLLEGGGGADTIAGGAGSDTASYARSQAGVAVDLGLSTAQAGGDAAGDLL
ncbi:MAG: hypothetical protein INF91_08580, partial [Alphaproteobacteria bacterium]|nr:hypothetical protein [Alphaproteobacteria bacterium]